VTETKCCSFCNKTQHEVRKLIVGPNALICDVCAELCNSICHEEGQKTLEPLPKINLPEVGFIDRHEAVTAAEIIDTFINFGLSNPTIHQLTAAFEKELGLAAIRAYQLELRDRQISKKADLENPNIIPFENGMRTRLKQLQDTYGTHSH